MLGILTPMLGTVQGDRNPADRIMLGGILTPLTSPDGDRKPNGFQSPSGPICTPLGS